MKHKNNITKFILVTIIFIYFIFNSNLIDSCKENLKGTIKNINYIKNVLNYNSDEIIEVQFIDVGQADAILIRQNYHNMLIDAGNNEDGQKLVSYLKKLGINSFDYVIATHAHEDHIGGMDDIINNFAIDNFYMPDILNTTKTFEDMLNELKKNNLLYEVLDEDEKFTLSNSLFDTIYVGNKENNLNDTSIVLKMSYGDISFLFMGDATSKVEKKILNKNIESDVLKVAHHGSNYSTTNIFLNKVKPLYAVISVGKNNLYKHPSSYLLKRLNSMNINIYRTDESGTIKFISNGKDIYVDTIITDTNA